MKLKSGYRRLKKIQDKDYAVSSDEESGLNDFNAINMYLWLKCMLNHFNIESFYYDSRQLDVHQKPRLQQSTSMKK